MTYFWIALASLIVAFFAVIIIRALRFTPKALEIGGDDALGYIQRAECQSELGQTAPAVADQPIVFTNRFESSRTPS